MTEQLAIPIKEIKEKSHIGFILKMLVFLAMIFAKNILDMPISESLLLIVAGLIAATGKKEEIITLYICFIPTSSAFQYKYAILMCIIIYTCKFYRDIKFNAYSVPLILMIVWEFLHSFEYDFDFNEYLRGFAELIFVTFLMFDKEKKINYPLLCRMLAVSTLVMCFIVLLTLLESNGYNFAGIFEGTYRLGKRDLEAERFGVNFNANELGLRSNLAIAGLMQLMALRRQKAIDYLMIVGLMFFGFLTMSRAFIICLAFVLVMFMLAKQSGIGGSIKTIIGLGVILSVAYYIMTNYAPFIIEKIFERFQEKDVSGGRVDLMSFYNKHIFSEMKYLFFGIGLQDIPYKIYLIHRTYDNVAHNGIQEILVVWGVPGLIMFIMFMKNIILSGKGEKNYKLINFIPLLLILLYVQSGQLITSGAALLSITFAYFSLQINFSEGKR